MPAKWTIEEHLIGLSNRLGTLRVLGVDLFLAAVKTFKALWPGEEDPKGPVELAERLMGSGARLTQWKESAGRVAADDAMSLVLSWYEDIDLGLLQNLRTNGKYVCQQEWIQKRKDFAYSLLEFADVHTFVDGPSFAAPAAGGEDEYEEVTDDEDAK